MYRLASALEAVTQPKYATWRGFQCSYIGWLVIYQHMSIEIRNHRQPFCQVYEA